MVRHLHRHRAVLLVARAGGETFPHLALHHHQQPGDRGRSLQHAHDDRNRDVVRQVRHADPRPVVVEQPPDRHGGGVGDHDARVAGLVAQLVLEHRGEPGVDLDGEHARSRLQQREGEGAEAGPDLEHTVAGNDLGQAHDAPGGVRVGEKVLPEALLRPQAVLGEQRVHGRGREERHLTATLPAAPRRTPNGQAQCSSRPQPQEPHPYWA